MGQALKKYPGLPGSPPSVTAILGAVFPKPALSAWKIRTTAELARQYPDEPIHGLMDRHPGPGGKNRGSRVHKAIEAALRDGDLPELEAEDQAMFKAFADWWGLCPFDVEAVEQTIWNPLLGYAGTADAFLRDDSGLLVADWKTCRELPAEPWPDHLAQLAAYAAFETVRVDLAAGDGVGKAGELPEAGLIVYLSELGDVRAFPIGGEDWDRAEKLWDHALGLARLLLPDHFPSAQGTLW